MKDLFRIEGFVEDKNLPKVKRMLTGIVLELRDAPVVNAAVKNGKMKAKTGGTTIELFAEWLKGRSGFTIAEVKEFCAQNGLASSSYTYVIKKARKANLIRSRGKGSSMTYHVVGRK